ncbi:MULTISPECIES: FliA/WhiG family RNA polymerase sigma factor [unclassified Caloramator]|jgi:RNA polymerase sigma factor for flagellar operon FliA|uniref:FliA/WhiG family RNA polymerase sigma factor n=1 Tax=unclassified Caloramator TaxID=2629145 RepID=UPI00237E09A9|nr:MULTISPECIES: FliA/WhiG family RNA polymerase sigma factor [unclassified Caloramator]MDO6355424.1 FliA/WhiG family RNA polymerase sigma factor [Caloramator sp. CAR-1]WDU83989.1 FliA/WhiG family RNA polymerase sigma factor [Caloramator sp. Dgby_cultured_2]
MKCYKQFDEREEMILRYLPYVKYIASRLVAGKPPGVEFEDLVSYGIIGLIDAIEKFDPTKGIKFETYATLRIKGAIIDELRKISWIPKSAVSKLSLLNQAREELESSLNREPTDKELADKLNISEEELKTIESYVNYVSLVSLEEIFFKSDEEDMQVKDFVEDANSPHPETIVENEERLKILREAISMLPEKDKLILNLYYFEKLTLKEIGKILEVSESRVSQLHSRAIIRLRENLKRLKYILEE